MNAPLSERAMDLVRKTYAQWRGAPYAHTTLVLAGMIVAGVIVRIQRISLPHHFTFDEHHYVGAAHHYLLRVPDLADNHPPLSKLLVATGMLLFGHNPMGWRFMSLCFGIQTILIAYWLASALFEDRRAGWFAAALFAADGFFLSYSRSALPDGVLNCLVLWSVLAAVTARSWRGVLTSGVLVGAAMSIKWSGMMAGLPAVVAILLLRRAPWHSLVSYAVVPVVHLGIFAVGLGFMGHPSDLTSVINVMKGMANTHMGFAHNTNPLSSSWYTWPILYHPIVVKYSSHGSIGRCASSMGNPLVWFTAGPSLLGLPIVGAVAATQSKWRKHWSKWFDTAFTKALVILLIGWIAMLLPWISGRTCTYWYHYMPSWSFAVLLLSGLIARLERRYAEVIAVFTLCVLGVAIYFAPVWGEFALSPSAIHRRLYFPSWQ